MQLTITSGTLIRTETRDLVGPIGTQIDADFTGIGRLDSITASSFPIEIGTDVYTANGAFLRDHEHVDNLSQRI